MGSWTYFLPGAAEVNRPNVARSSVDYSPYGGQLVLLLHVNEGRDYEIGLLRKTNMCMYIHL